MVAKLVTAGMSVNCDMISNIVLTCQSTNGVHTDTRIQKRIHPTEL